jgi:hypothetical protein
VVAIEQAKIQRSLWKCTARRVMWDYVWKLPLENKLLGVILWSENSSSD